MSFDRLNNYIFENEFIRNESSIKGFTQDLFNEINLKANNLSLRSKIEDLINGDIINHTEKQAAWHAKYRTEGPRLHNHLHRVVKKIKKTEKILNINIIIVLKPLSLHRQYS